MKRRDIGGFLFLLGVSLTLFGYQALEGDQASRLFHLLAQLDPTLYRQDWYVQGYEGMNPHLPYFAGLGFFTRLLGLSAALQVAYLLMVTMLGWGAVRLYRNLFPTHPWWAGWFAAVVVVCCQCGNLGNNAIFESQFKPRELANGFALVAAAYLLSENVDKRSAGIAGVFVVLSILAHVGVGILVVGLFGLIVSLWIVQKRISRSSGALFLFFNLLALALRLPYLTGVDSRLAASPEEVQLMQTYYILGHEGHFYPPSWPLHVWVGFLALGLLMAKGWPLLSGSVAPKLKSSGLVTAASLLVGAFFSSVVMVYKLMLIQPFRLVTLSRAVMAVILAAYLVNLWRANVSFGRPRALFVLASLTSDWTALFALINEWAESKRPGVSRVVLPLALSFSLSLEPKTGILQVGCLALGFLASKIEWNSKIAAILLLGSLFLPTLALLLQVALPNHSLSRQTSRRWFFRPIPRDDLARAALWARDNTDRDAIFLTPPLRAGFRLWSQRAVVFDYTTPPLSAREIKEWRERMFALGGLTGAESTGTFEAGKEALEGYQDYDADTLLGLAETYQAHYVVTPKKLESVRLIPVHTAGDLTVYSVSGD